MATTPKTTPYPKPRQRSDRPVDGGGVLGHVHLKTADLDRVYDFYVGILGFDVTLRRRDSLFVSAGGYHHHLAFNEWESKGGPQPPPGTTGLYHVAIRYPTRAALGEALDRLIRAGWPLDGINDHGTHEALYLSDPDGNGLELCWDRPREEWPLDEEGHVDLSHHRLDLEGLLAEGRALRRRQDEEAAGS
ncbi:MAG: VOC family protein [bacterium]|jgi:catechol 2,3-dioxygenase|nr:VOC family protein [bacterium]